MGLVLLTSLCRVLKDPCFTPSTHSWDAERTMQILAQNINTNRLFLLIGRQLHWIMQGVQLISWLVGLQHSLGTCVNRDITSVTMTCLSTLTMGQPMLLEAHGGFPHFTSLYPLPSLMPAMVTSDTTQSQPPLSRERAGDWLQTGMREKMRNGGDNSFFCTEPWCGK